MCIEYIVLSMYTVHILWDVSAHYDDFCSNLIVMTRAMVCIFCSFLSMLLGGIFAGMEDASFMYLSFLVVNNICVGMWPRVLGNDASFVFL